jgi:hypothetical protein
MKKLRLIKPWHLRAMPQRLNNQINTGAELLVTCKGPSSSEEFFGSNKLLNNRIAISFDGRSAGRDFCPQSGFILAVSNR